MFSVVSRAVSGAMIVAGLSLGGCVASGGGPAAQSPLPANSETAAMAATFRYIFAHNASAMQSSAATYCLSAGTPPNGADPSPELLRALADVQPHVQPASACRTGAQVVNAAGKPSLIFNLAVVRCDGAEGCLFNGGYYEGNVSASTGQYRTRLVDGAWQVTVEGPQAIS